MLAGESPVRGTVKKADVAAGPIKASNPYPFDMTPLLSASLLMMLAFDRTRDSKTETALSHVIILDTMYCRVSYK